MEQQDGIDEIATHPTVFFGHEESENSHVAELRPELGGVARAVLPRVANEGRRAFVVEQIAQSFGEEALVVGERELHGSGSLRQL